MISEHNSNAAIPKSPFEEEDLSSGDLRYVANRLNHEILSNEENEFPSDENSAMINDYFEAPEQKDQHVATQKVKTELQERDESFFHESVLTEILNDKNAEYSYQEFKNLFIRENDDLTMKCVACDRIIIKTSVAAHLRLWHANLMMFNCELCTEGFRRNDYRLRHMTSAHPNDFKCHLCSVQFHRSVLYKDHMKDVHKIFIKTEELKSKEEIDVPFENMKFVQKTLENVRVCQFFGNDFFRKI
jgi:hypothetical protein